MQTTFSLRIPGWVEPTPNPNSDAHHMDGYLYAFSWGSSRARTTLLYPSVYLPNIEWHRRMKIESN